VLALADMTAGTRQGWRSKAPESEALLVEPFVVVQVRPMDQGLQTKPVEAVRFRWLALVVWRCGCFGISLREIVMGLVFSCLNCCDRRWETLRKRANPREKRLLELADS
jgi:hypothetical protein